MPVITSSISSMIMKHRFREGEGFRLVGPYVTPNGVEQILNSRVQNNCRESQVSGENNQI